MEKMKSTQKMVLIPEELYSSLKKYNAQPLGKNKEGAIEISSKDITGGEVKQDRAISEGKNRKNQYTCQIDTKQDNCKS